MSEDKKIFLIKCKDCGATMIEDGYPIVTCNLCGSNNLECIDISNF